MTAEQDQAAQHLADLTGTPVSQIRLAAGMTALCPACQGWGKWHMASCTVGGHKRRTLSWAAQAPTAECPAGPITQEATP